MSLVALKRKSQRFQNPVSKNGFSSSGIIVDKKCCKKDNWVKNNNPLDNSQSSYITTQSAINTTIDISLNKTNNVTTWKQTNIYNSHNYIVNSNKTKNCLANNYCN
tara:strand:- start:1997 stop:2314 length:318 start_codon:yes stop_codon:yes gene_type:complete